jgi:fructose-bisphosphate aldolase, class II
VAATRVVVEYAKRMGALVESEPHYFGGSSTVHREAIDEDELRHPARLFGFTPSGDA